MARTADDGIESGNSDDQNRSLESGNENGSGRTEEETIYTSGGDDHVAVNPADIARGSGSGGEESSGRKGRGRPKGSRNANAASGRKQTKETASDLTALLLSGHMMLAALTKTAELELDPSEAERLGAAVARVNAEFGGMVFSPKTAAMLNLTMVAGAVYGPRIMAVKMRLDNEKKESKQPGGVTGIAATTPISKVVTLQ